MKYQNHSGSNYKRTRPEYVPTQGLPPRRRSMSVRHPHCTRDVPYMQSWKSYSYAAACGVSDKVLWQTLKDRPCIRKVCIFLDNDEIGQRASQRISKALGDKNIENRILVPIRKDWNEDLMFWRKEEGGCRNTGLQLPGHHLRRLRTQQSNRRCPLRKPRQPHSFVRICDPGKR